MPVEVNSVIVAGIYEQPRQFERGPLAFNLTAQRSYEDRDGKMQTFRASLDCKAWGKVAERMHSMLAEGEEILVEGRLDRESWDGKNGKQYRTMIVVTKFQFLSGIDRKEEIREQPQRKPEPVDTAAEFGASAPDGESLPF